MIVRDEAENLGRALASVKKVADELIVVDTGSVDDSVAVARRFGARIGYFKWCDDFAAARNAAVAMATSHWILSLDADEELLPESVQALRDIVAIDPVEPTVATVRALSTFDSGEVDVAAVPRLASNFACVRFHRPIHEEFGHVDGGPLFRFDAAGIMLRHSGYHRAARGNMGKSERNLRILARELAKQPDDPVNNYYLGLEYAALGYWDEAVATYGRHMAVMEQRLPLAALVRSRYHYTIALFGLGRFAEAAEVGAQGAHRYGHASLHLATVMPLLQLGRYDEATEHANQAIERAPLGADEMMPAPVLMATARVTLGDIAAKRDGIEIARGHFQAAVELAPRLCYGHIRLAELEGFRGDPAAGVERLRALLPDLPDDQALHTVLSQLERKCGLLRDCAERLADVLGRTPHSLALRFELAETLYEAGEHATGVEVLGAALELPQLRSSPPTFRARYYDRLGFGLLQTDRLQEAMQAYQIAHQVDPSLAAPRAVLEGYQVMVPARVPEAPAAVAAPA